MMSLEGRVALVTGSTSGIGLAYARAFASAGANIVLNGMGAPADIEKERSGIEKDFKVKAVHSPADMTRPAEIAEMIALGEKTFGAVDILVNNAGIGQGAIREDQRWNPIRFWEITPEEWSRFLAVNATAPLMMARAVAPHMLKAGAGRIVTVTTSLGTMLRAGYTLCGASKAAAEAATAIMSEDLKDTAITANVLVPGGAANTRMVSVGQEPDRAKLVSPDVMAAPLVWLCSNASDGVNGLRFIGARWDQSLPPAEAAKKAGAPAAWQQLGRQAIVPNSPR